jgi:hypothetical protein
MKKCILLPLLLVAFVPVRAENCCSSAKTDTGRSVAAPTDHSESDAAAIRGILAKINIAAKQLESCQAAISYLFIQDPELLDTHVLRTGTLYYQKQDGRSNLRIRFDDIKQDDFAAEKQREEYLFDGVWLTHINFKLEQIDLYQQAPEDKPIDVFELINHNFPLIGFSGTDHIEKEFDISLKHNPADPNEPPCLILTVKNDSKFKESYEKVLFTIDEKLNLPRKVVAFTPQKDESHVDFSYVNVNKKLKNAVFALETPKHFRKNIERLENQPLRKEE